MNRQERIHQHLLQTLEPSMLFVEDESHHHHVPQGAETHFKITAVSTHFHNLAPLARHRLVNKLVTQEFNLGLHALSLHLFTPEEWQKRGSTLQSPTCRGGYEEKNEK